jgi:uncharacterized Fe-S cluster-containing radical SAM superfamily protein
LARHQNLQTLPKGTSTYFTNAIMIGTGESLETEFSNSSMVRIRHVSIVGERPVHFSLSLPQTPHGL